MSSTLRCISLLGCLLSVACSERTSPASGTSAPARAAEVLPKQEPPQLTSTLPSAPDSIADAPPSPSAEGVKAQPAPEPTPVLTDAPDPAHDEPELALDRAVDPAEVRVDRFVLAAGVEQREPLGETDVFTSDTEKIYAFVQLANDKEPYAVKVHFESAEGPASPYGIALAVPTAPRHRTWAWTRIKRTPGRYRAVLRTLEGQEIARREFLIEDMR